MAPSPQRPQRAKAAIHRRRHSASGAGQSALPTSPVPNSRQATPCPWPHVPGHPRKCHGHGAGCPWCPCAEQRWSDRRPSVAFRRRYCSVRLRQLGKRSGNDNATKQARCTVGRDGDDKVGWTSYKFPDCDIPRCMPSKRRNGVACWTRHRPSTAQDLAVYTSTAARTRPPPGNPPHTQTPYLKIFLSRSVGG